MADAISDWLRNPEPGLQWGDVAAGVYDWATGQNGTGQPPPAAPPAAPPGTPAAQNGTAQTVGGIPIKIPVQVKPIAWVPRGYVVVRDPATGVKFGMLRKAAIACGLWKPARKPPISASDWRAIAKANRAANKLKTMKKRAANIKRTLNSL